MKPLMRGYIHQVAFFIALLACARLISHSHSNLALVSNIIYSLSLTGLYGISALYHCPFWRNHHTYVLMGKIDHAAIFILIAGTGTPVCLLGLAGKSGWMLFGIIWCIALIGILMAFSGLHRLKFIRAILYVAAGWMVFPFIPEIKSSLGTMNLWYLISGGIIYTLGALVYALKKPDLFPRVFGYHEVFHVLVVIASILHFIVIYHLTMRL